MKKIILFLILASIILIIGCKEEIVEEEGTAEEAAPPVPPEMAEEAAEPEEPAAVEILSGLRCMDNKIEATITNTKADALEITKDVKVVVNGLVVIDPECDTLILQPGESTYCSDVTGHYAIRQGKVNTVQLNLKGESIVEYVDCVAAE